VTLRDLVVVRLGVIVNLVIGQLVAALLLPLFLDAVGTILVAALVGPVAAIVTGLTSQVLAAVLSGNFTWLPFGVIQVLIAVYAWLAARAGVFRRVWTAAPAGLVLGFLAGMTAAPIALKLFGGATAGGVTAVTATLRAVGLPLDVAVRISSVSTDLLDKTVAFVMVALILRALPEHMAARFPAHEGGRTGGPADRLSGGPAVRRSDGQAVRRNGSEAQS
jgi:energy-coupling factor transport system substrate-specific component